MEEYLRIINQNQKKNDPKAKSAWYFLGKELMKGSKPVMHKEKKTGARRVYQYYYKAESWDGPSPRKLAKMRKMEFDRLMGRDDIKRGILWKEQTPKAKKDSVLPPFLLDWDETELELNQSIPDLGDLMRDPGIVEDPGSSAEFVQPQHDDTQQEVAS